MTATLSRTVPAKTARRWSSALRPLQSPMRPILAAAALLVAGAHIPMIAPHLDEAPYMGVLFVVLTVGCLAISLATLIRDSAALYASAAFTCGLAVLGYAATRVVAFPMLADDVGNWLEPLGVVSVVGELTVIAIAATALHGRRPLLRTMAGQTAQEQRGRCRWQAGSSPAAPGGIQQPGHIDSSGVLTRMTPEVGTELVNPVAATKTVFTATAESTGGDHVEVEATYPPNNAKPPRHLHPGQTEQFRVLAGSLEVRRGDEAFTVTVGDEFSVEPGVPHQMWAGEDGAVFRWRTSPPLRTGEQFCALWECARDNDWHPTAGQLFEVVSTYRDEFRLA